MRKWLNFQWFLVSLLFLCLDQITKLYIVQFLSPDIALPLFSGLNLTLTYNSGMAFSLFSFGTEVTRWVLVAISGSISLFLLLWLFRCQLYQQRLCCALTLILGGALGNLVDRVMYGYVIDFIDCYWKSFHWYTFNFADMAISIGACLFILDVLVDKREH